MKTITVYDPAMCCSTGVCGPEVDPKLAQFAADLKWLQERGATVTRHTLSQNPAAFMENPSVKTALMEKGETALPLVFSEDSLLGSGVYPSRDELAAAAGLADSSACCGDGAAQQSKDGCCGGEEPGPATASRCCG
jgi:hypothetical protein